jgi:HAD superfamily hydrolase (TIGR01509 family)
MKLEGIIFDVDGTIADTEDIHRQAFNKAFSEYNLNWHWSREKYYELLFISGGKERIRKYLTENNTINIDNSFIKELHKCKSEYYRSMLISADIKLRPGIKRLITEAKNLNIKLGIATNSSGANLTTLIKKNLGTQPEQLFNTIATSDIVLEKKPSPEIYHHALLNLNLSAKNCVVIEDTTNGNISALTAGLRTIITTHAYTKDNDFNGASLVINNLGEPDSAFNVNKNFDCKNTYVNVELLNKIVTSKNDFLQKEELLKISEHI